jgi:hypothetical protein
MNLLKELEQAYKESDATFKEFNEHLDFVSACIKNTEDYLLDRNVVCMNPFFAFKIGEDTVHITFDRYQNSTKRLMVRLRVEQDTCSYFVNKPIIEVELEIRVKIAQYLPAFIRHCANEIKLLKELRIG